MKASTVKLVSAGVWLVTIAMMIPMTGCNGRALDEAQQEARAANKKARQLELLQAQTRRALQGKEDELRVVQRRRDELQREVNALRRDKDEAAEEAQRVHGMVQDWQTQAAGQADTAASLEQQVADLKAQVAQLQATITEQQTTIAERDDTIATLEAGVTEMWNGLQQNGDYTAYTGDQGNY